ncbi:phospholipase D family protein [Pasteurella multocida]|uniref:phospholipase D family protein n=1 Tax=Pasteurella multocida TaxID=747 RepID=UPI00397BA4F2
MLIVIIKKLFLLLALILFSLVILALISYQRLPTSDRPISTHPPLNPNGLLARHILPQVAQHTNLTGLYPLGDGKDAFLARLALSEHAEHTLDLQYYIWHNDVSGHLLLQSLYKAAVRGVKVRLLLDDNNTKGMDTILASLNAHPNIQIRLFNPFMQRQYRWLGFLSDFFRLNRRMHNKSFTADGVMSILGGRNIGDEYFDVGNGVLFADLDVAATGAVVTHIQTDFDRYWNSPSSYPLESIIIRDPITPFNPLPALDDETQTYLKQLTELPFAKSLKAGTLAFTWAEAELISDDPKKALGKSLIQDSVLAHIAPTMLNAKNNLIIVSPYFVPTHVGVDFLSRISQTGTQVSILTNSLEATDVSIVHSGYAKHRKTLLQKQIQLYELKPHATIQMESSGHLLKGASSASLHAKTFTLDNRYLFVGSFNMDPRSAMLNTEMGLLIDSPELARLLSDGLQQNQANYAFSVKLNEAQALYWETQENGQWIRYENEPHTSWFKRFSVWCLSWLPVEHLL